LGGPGPPQIVIYSLKERKSGFYSLHLHLLMRPLDLDLMTPFELSENAKAEAAGNLLLNY
jgi:hypothetical protein